MISHTCPTMPGGVPLPGWGGVSSDRLGYDGAGRMITKRYLTGGINETTKAYNNTTSLVGATTSFDRAGNKFFERHLEAEDRSHLYQPFNSDGSFGVGYDSANRLLQYQRGVLNGDVTPYLVPAGASIDIPTTLPGADQVRTYGLDGLGNWKTTNFTEVGSGGSTTSTAETRAHNYVNEITSTRDGTSSATPFTYDKNGNLLNDGIRSYKYDALNRLVQVKKVSGGALIGAYVYDGLNRRIQKTISNGGLTGGISNGTTNYLYDDQQIVTERDEDGNWLKANFWGQYIDELLFFAVPTETVPTTYRVLSDLLYRSTAIVTTSNVITEAYDCDAYGNTLCYSGPGTDGLWFTDDDVQTNNPINTTIFTGRQYDPESQIYYYRARYYSPSIGRFLSRDSLGFLFEMVDQGLPTWVYDYQGNLTPVKGAAQANLSQVSNASNNPFAAFIKKKGLEAELTQGPNLYWYVQANPANNVDPLGLQVIPPQSPMYPGPFPCQPQQIVTCVAYCQKQGLEFIGCYTTVVSTSWFGTLTAGHCMCEFPCNLEPGPGRPTNYV